MKASREGGGHQESKAPTNTSKARELTGPEAAHAQGLRGSGQGLCVSWLPVWCFDRSPECENERA